MPHSVTFSGSDCHNMIFRLLGLIHDFSIKIVIDFVNL